MEFHYTVPGDDFTITGNASQEIKKTLQRLGLPSAVIKRTAVAMYEAEINMVVHAGGGEATVDISPEKITILMEDHGPGIPNIDLAMQEGYSTASEKVRELGFGAGMGLPNMKRNSNALNIESTVGKGTKVTMVILVEENGATANE